MLLSVSAYSGMKVFRLFRLFEISVPPEKKSSAERKKIRRKKNGGKATTEVDVYSEMARYPQMDGFVFRVRQFICS
jgi:hypothetical protein